MHLIYDEDIMQDKADAIREACKLPNSFKMTPPQMAEILSSFGDDPRVILKASDIPITNSTIPGSVANLNIDEFVGENFRHDSEYKTNKIKMTLIINDIASNGINKSLQQASSNSYVIPLLEGNSIGGGIGIKKDANDGLVLILNYGCVWNPTEPEATNGWYPIRTTIPIATNVAGKTIEFIKDYSSPSRIQLYIDNTYIGDYGSEYAWEGACIDLFLPWNKNAGSRSSWAIESDHWGGFSMNIDTLQIEYV